MLKIDTYDDEMAGKEAQRYPSHEMVLLHKNQFIYCIHAYYI